MVTDMALDDTPCPIIDSLRQIGSQWRLIILHGLQDDKKRFSELKRSTGVDSRILSRVLNDLQGHGFVNRRTEEDAPAMAYYSLADRGVSLYPVFDEIREWATEWFDAEREESTEGKTVWSTA